jgi:hypothetical protein
LAINLNQPGTYLHWSIFTVSVANLVLIAVMVLIFGAALLLPFPKGRVYPAEEPPLDPATGEPARPETRDVVADEDASMWTARVRRRALAALPPGKLLPDRQPAYAASWVYVFGVASLASVVECFTGYLSQQNFDSQWISASGKDAFNPVGLGAFWNVMNFGQMLMWHIVLVPIVLVAVVGAHVLLVRVRGVSHPVDAPPTSPSPSLRSAVPGGSAGGRSPRPTPRRGAARPAATTSSRKGSSPPWWCWR